METSDTKIPQETDTELLREATAYGYTGFFAHRDTLQAAYDHAMGIVEGLGTEGARMVVGVQVLLNTVAIASAKRARVIKQLEELARATKSYCEDNAKSERRRLAMIEGADQAIAAAKEHL